MNIQKYNKAIIPVIAAVIYMVLNYFSVTKMLTPEQVQLITLVATALGVYTVPNKE